MEFDDDDDDDSMDLIMNAIDIEEETRKHKEKKTQIEKCIIPKSFGDLKFDKYRSNVFDTKEESIIFYYTGGTYMFDSDLGAVLQINGNLNDDANTPLFLKLYGFDPFFYVEVPQEWMISDNIIDDENQCHGASRDKIETYIAKLRIGFMDYINFSGENTFKYEKFILNKFTDPIKDWNTTTGVDLMGYSGGPRVFVKITTTYPKFVKLFRDLVDNPNGRAPMKSKFFADTSSEGYTLPEVPMWCNKSDGKQGNMTETEYKLYIAQCHKIKTYEADVDFVTRWMTETQRGPCEWYYIPRDRYFNIIDSKERYSRSGLEIQVKYTNMIPLTNHEKYTNNVAVDRQLLADIHPLTPSDYELKFPNFKILVFDFECLMDPNHVPDYRHDPILQAGIILADMENKHTLKRIGLALENTKKPDNVDILYWFKTETALICAFRDIYNGFDPDIECGHNHANFDWTYVNGRAKVLGISKTLLNVGRVKNGAMTSVSKTVRGFKQTSIKIAGRISFDTMKYAQSVIPPKKECSLNALGEEMLGESKEDFPYELIAASQKTIEGRTRMMKYCMKDVILTYGLLVAFNCILTQMNLSKISKVLPQECMNRGQEAKVDGKVRFECVPPIGSTATRVLKVSGQYKRNRVKDVIQENESKESLKQPIQKRKRNNRSTNEISAIIKKKGEFSTIAQYGREEDEYNPDDMDDYQDDFNDEDTYKGATVIQPKKGFYARVRLTEVKDIVCSLIVGDDPMTIPRVKSGEFIVDTENKTIRDTKNDPGWTLDFAGMYPGIQMEHNISWDTIVTQKDIEIYKLTRDDYWIVPDYKEGPSGELILIENTNNPKYVKAHIKEGIIPKMQKQLMKFRGDVKVKMGQCLKNRIAAFEFQRDCARFAELLSMRDKATTSSKILDKENIEEYEFIRNNKSKSVKLEKLNEYLKGMRDAMKKFITTVGYDDVKKVVDDFSKIEAMVDKCVALLNDEILDVNEINEIKEFIKSYIVRMAALEKKYSFQEKIYDGIQNAIKAWMNSVYGKSGDRTSPYYIREMASSVTDTGRVMIRLIRDTVINEYNKKKGFPFDTDVIYGDTDSIFPLAIGLGILYSYKNNGEVKPNLSECDKYGTAMAATCSKLFKPPTKLEYEKAWLNLILIEKKNYAYAKYEIGKPVPKIDIKGIEVIKRGPPPFVRRAGVKMLNKICMESDVDGSIRHYIDEKKRLRSGELPFTDFIYMKKLSKDPRSYKGVTPVTSLIDRMKKRDNNYNASVGDILKWILVDMATIDGDITKSKNSKKTSTKKNNISARIEDPIYVLNKNLPIDYREYENHLDSVFFKIMKEVVWSIDKESDQKTYTRYKQSDLNSFFKKKTTIASNDVPSIDEMQKNIIQSIVADNKNTYDTSSNAKNKKTEHQDQINEVKDLFNDSDKNELDNILHDDILSLMNEMTLNNDEPEDMNEDNENDPTSYPFTDAKTQQLNKMLDAIEFENRFDSSDQKIEKINHQMKRLIVEELSDEHMNNNNNNNNNINQIPNRNKIQLRTLWIYKRKVLADINLKKKNDTIAKKELTKSYVLNKYKNEAVGIFDAHKNIINQNTIEHSLLFQHIKNIKCKMCNTILKRDDYIKKDHQKIEYDDDCFVVRITEDGRSIDDDMVMDGIYKLPIDSNWFNDNRSDILLCKECSSRSTFSECCQRDSEILKSKKKEYDEFYQKCMNCTGGFKEGIEKCRCTSCDTLGKRIMTNKQVNEYTDKIKLMNDIKKALDW
jgi:DNA polymerase elongation subunit (family B)